MNFRKIFALIIVALVANPIYSQESSADFENYSLLNHKAAIKDIVFSKNKKNMASVSDSTIIIWELTEFGAKRPIEQIRFTDQANVNSVCFTSKEGQLISGGYSQVLSIWNYTTGKKEKVFKIRYPESDVITMKSSEKRSILKNQWSTGTSKFEKNDKGSFPSIINSVLESGGDIYTGQRDNTMKSWEISSNYGGMKTFGRSSEWHKWSINDLCFSKDKRSIFTASGDNTIKKWSVSGNRLEKTMTGHTRSVTRIVSSANNKFIASIGADNSLRVWDTYGNEVCGVLGERNRINDLTFSLDGKYLATAEEYELCLWAISPKTGKLSLIGRIDAHRGREITAVAFIPTTDNIEVLSGCVDGEIKSWNIKILVVRKYFEKEYAKKKKASGLFKEKGEFEKTGDYYQRKQLGSDFEKKLDREYLAKYKTVKVEYGESEIEGESKPIEKKILLKIDQISTYNADNEKFDIVIKGVEKSIKIPIKDAQKFKKYYKKAIVKAVEITTAGKKRIVKVQIIDPNTKKIYNFGNIDED